jgi:hypothetical protein
MPAIVAHFGGAESPGGIGRSDACRSRMPIARAFGAMRFANDRAMTFLGEPGAESRRLRSGVRGTGAREASVQERDVARREVIGDMKVVNDAATFTSRSPSSSATMSFARKSKPAVGSVPNAASVTPGSVRSSRPTASRIGTYGVSACNPWMMEQR